jgi:TPR repeat protein
MSAAKELLRIQFDDATRVNEVVERRARLPKRAYLIPSLLSRDEATLVRRLAESDPTARFARDPDTVDRLPTFECAVFDGGRPVATAVCRVLEPVVTERLLPYLRKRFDCSSLELSQALIRRYLPTERREHPAHFDAHATATVVVSLCDPEDYVGGYYAQPTSDAASARYASLDVGDAFCHGHDLRHGVRVLSGARYSLVLWFTPRAHRFRRRRTSTIPPWHRYAAARGEADALYNVAARDASEAARCASSGDVDGAARLAARAADGHERAAAAGSADAMLNVGVLRYNSGDLAGAAACWRKAAQNGKGNACRYYARCLTRGEGVREDRAAATRWLKKGAAAGDASAAYSLYLAGIDSDKHLALAAASGHAAACVDLAKTASSSREAITLLRRAVANGGAAAAYCALGRLFLGAPGLVPDPSAAAGFFARNGNAEAQACLAALYGPVPRILRDPTSPSREGGMLLLW